MQAKSVIGVRYLGKIKTCDIEVDNNNHLFYANGIATSNSHGVGYATTSFWCAYLKAHFPVLFFSSYLELAHDKQDPKEEIRELIKEAKLFNIEICPPRLLLKESHFHTDGHKVYFGLCDIKGVGESSFGNLIKRISAHEDKIGKSLDKWSWYDFLIGISRDINSSAVKALINAGALDYGLSRKQMYYEYTKWSELTEKEQDWVIQRYDQFDSLRTALSLAYAPKKHGGATIGKRTEIVKGIYQSLANPASDLNDNPYNIIAYEEYLLGLPITMHRTDIINNSSNNTSCKDFMNDKIGKVIIVGEIKKIRKFKVKQGKNVGKEMAYLSIEDSSAVLDNVVVFPDQFKTVKSIIAEGKIGIFKGHQGNDGGFIVREFTELE